MSFLRRMFSSDYRAAVAAEAAGNVDLAAERYALAGEHAGAVRMHLARAARAPTRTAEIGALRDALRWAGEEPALKRQAAAALGRALYEAARAEGIATERDRTRVREAAALLVIGDDHHLAGEALEAIGDHLGAANAYTAGGLVEKMEKALERDDVAQNKEREEADAFAGYETGMRVGRRDDARAELVRAVQAAAVAGEYRRKLDQLDTALLTAGRVELKRRGKPLIVACAAHKLVLGRDQLCDLTLRAGGVSRQHAEIELSDDKRTFALRDLDSRNGTTLSGMPLAGRVPLEGSGRFGLGDECTIDFERSASALVLRIATGLDRGAALVAAVEGERIDLAPLGTCLDLVFQRGRPLLGRGACKDVRFNDEPLGDVRVQLIRGDRIVADGDEIDVA
ncbi:MAG: FHA domain-containing protein [Deltaproteobacteria bacterium]|nr:FHA domain-containing protein [Deltaproteobacteria bacterium]